MMIGIGRLASSAARRLARGDFSGFLGALRREVRVPTTNLGRRLSSTYAPVANSIERIRNGRARGRGPDTSLYLFYDLEIAPITYDFAWTLISAEVRRLELGLSQIRVVFVPGPVAGGREEAGDYNNYIDRDARAWRLWNVLVALCPSLPSVDEVVVCRTRSQAAKIFFSEATNVFPDGYSPNAPVISFHEVAYAASGDLTQIAALRALPEGRKYVHRWIKSNCPDRDLVVITLRQADYFKSRNSKLEEWQEFSRRLDPQRYCIAVIPDTDKIAEFDTSGWGNAFILREAAFNLQVRNAFYEDAFVSLAVDSGPMVLALLNAQTAFAIFIRVLDDVAHATAEYFTDRGFQIGRTPPFCTPRQRWIWEEARADVIERVFHELETEIRRSSGARSALSMAG